MEEHIEYPIFIRSSKLLEMKNHLAGRLPEREGAWAVFRFIYDNFKVLRKVSGIIKENGLEPRIEESREYLEERFFDDPHVGRMSGEELKRIHTYIIMYESIMPIYPESSTIPQQVINDYSIYPSSSEVRFRRRKDYFPKI